MRTLICLSFAYTLLQSSVALAHTSSRIGYNAGAEMAARLWANKYQRDCWNSDRFFAEIDKNKRGLSSSGYHEGYKQGISIVEDKVAKECHSTKIGSHGAPKGECPETGFQHGNNLGAQVCNGSRSRSMAVNTCSQQAMSTCYEGLQKYVRDNCSGMFRTASYKQAERDCQQTFSMR